MEGILYPSSCKQLIDDYKRKVTRTVCRLSITHAPNHSLILYKYSHVNHASYLYYLAW